MNALPPRSYDDPRAQLQSRLAPLLTELDAPLARTRLIYRISGGPPSRRLEATLEVTDRGEVKHELFDEMQNSEREVVQTKIAPQDARELLREVVRSELLSQPTTAGGFLPDSIVGSIIVQSGDAQFVHHFLADDRQRHRQGLPLTPPVKRLRPKLEALRSRAREESQRSFEPPT